MGHEHSTLVTGQKPWWGGGRVLRTPGPGGVLAWPRQWEAGLGVEDIPGGVGSTLAIRAPAVRGDSLEGGCRPPAAWSLA